MKIYMAFIVAVASVIYLAGSFARCMIPRQHAQAVEQHAPETRFAIDSAELPTVDGMDGESFKALVIAAIGYDAIPEPGLMDHVNMGDYRGGSIASGVMRYAGIGMDVTYLYASHGKADAPLITILHGHTSSAAAVMGLADLDCMLQVGAEMFDRGYDVLALDTTSGMEESEYLNGQLSLYGIQIYGLWAHAAIAATEHVAAGHSSISVYGLSNGGMIAQFIGVIESPFDTVIVGDVFMDRRVMAKGHATLHRTQNYSLFFLAPLWANAPMDAWIQYTTSSVYYTLKPGEYADMADALNMNANSPDAAARLVRKHVDDHVPEPALIAAILSGHADEYDMVSR